MNVASVAQPFRELAFLIRAGCAGGPVAAFAVVFLFAFAEFEMASLMVVKSWTVALFDAHAGGLALSESLRRMPGPLLCEAAAIATAFVVLGRRQVIPARRIDGQPSKPMVWLVPFGDRIYFRADDSRGDGVVGHDSRIWPAPGEFCFEP